MADTYMRDEAAKSIGGMIESLQIFARHVEKGLQQKFFLQGEHDVIYAYIDTAAIPPESDDGKRLTALGWHVEDGNWAMFT